MTRDSLLRHNPALAGRTSAPMTPVGGFGILGAPASALGGGLSGSGMGRSSSAAVAAVGSAGTSPDDRAGMLRAIVSAASHAVGEREV